MLPELVVYLLGKNAHREGAKLTTKEMANELDVSQQTISRWMIELEQMGFLDRSNREIRLSQKAVSEAEKVYNVLKASLEKNRQYLFSGKVVAGLGTGSSFLKIKGYSESLQKKLGFKPFPGTLNVRIPPEEIELRLSLRQGKEIDIPGFEHGGKRFGKLAIFKAKLFGEPAAVIFPEMSHHGLDVLEIISPDNLRQRYKLADGSAVNFVVYGLD
jgi:riboflavin kinase, archaea type